MSNIYIGDFAKNVIELHCELLQDSTNSRTIRERLDWQAHRVFETIAKGDERGVVHLSNWSPILVSKSTEAIMSYDVTIEIAREALAREYGFANWAEVEQEGNEPPDPDFEAAVNHVINGNLKALSEIISQNPEIIKQQSAYPHRAMLLHYVAANGVETHRQFVPYNAAEVARRLLEAGADVNATAEMYGGGSTPIGLLVTSSHPAKAGVTEDILKVFHEFGAKEN